MTIRSRLFAAVFSTALLAAGVSRAGCERYPTPEEEFAGADFVYIALVTGARLDREAGDDWFTGVEYTVEPWRIFKGDPPPELALYSENSTARFPMMTAGLYLVFVGPPYRVGYGRAPRFSRAIDPCGNSFAIEIVPLALGPHTDPKTFDEAMQLLRSREEAQR